MGKMIYKYGFCYILLLVICWDKICPTLVMHWMVSLLIKWEVTYNLDETLVEKLEGDEIEREFY